MKKLIFLILLILLVGSTQVDAQFYRRDIKAATVTASDSMSTVDINITGTATTTTLTADSTKINGTWYNNVSDFKAYGVYTALLTEVAPAQTTSGSLVTGMRYTITTYITVPQDTATSGTITVGWDYLIETFVAGDDFTNVGADSNATGCVFTATGTTPTTWANGSTLVGIPLQDDFANVGADSNATGCVFIATGTTPTVWDNSSELDSDGAPYGTVLENTLTGTVVWTYTGAGVYAATLAGEFLAGKTFLFINDGLAPNAGKLYILRTSDDVITVYSDITNGTATDGLMVGASIEIRVYP